MYRELRSPAGIDMSRGTGVGTAIIAPMAPGPVQRSTSLGAEFQPCHTLLIIAGLQIEEATDGCSDVPAGSYPSAYSARSLNAIVILRGDDLPARCTLPRS